MRRYLEMKLKMDRMPAAFFVVDGQLVVPLNNGSLAVISDECFDLNALFHPDSNGVLKADIITQGRVGNLDSVAMAHEEMRNSGVGHTQLWDEIESAHIFLARKVREMFSRFKHERVGDVPMTPVIPEGD